MSDLTETRLSRLMRACLVAVMLFAASKTASANNTLEFLNSTLPTDIQIERPNSRSLRFCPDNTCEELVFHHSTKVQEAEEIFAIYLYFESDYWLLEDWRKQVVIQNFVRKAVDKHRPPACAKTDYTDASKCVLRWLFRKHRIRIFDIGYDEGSKSVTPRETPRSQSK